MKKYIKTLKAYRHYCYLAMLEIYLYYFSLSPLLIILRNIALANRKVRIIWTKNNRGRRPLDQEIVDLIIKLKFLNPTWGAQKISDELAKVGFRACKRTVQKYLEINGLNSPIITGKSTWTELLNSHHYKIGIDFTSLISLLGHQLYIFVVIDLDTRELLWINVTYDTCTNWIIQQFRNFHIDLKHPPTLCICDRDSVFSKRFKESLKDFFNIVVMHIPYRRPDKNGRVERFHLSLKKEAFADVTPIGLSHAISISNQYRKYYNDHRPHQGISGNIPSQSAPILLKNKVPYKIFKHLNGKISSLEVDYGVAA